MRASIIIAIAIIVSSIAFSAMAWFVNREDTVRMEVAAQNGLVQCQQGTFVLWKKSCNE